MTTIDQHRDEYALSPHVTPAVQLRTLRAVFRQVAEASRASGPRPVVEVDLDLCGLMPVHRTRRALAAVAREFGVARLGEPEGLPTLPGYSDEAWSAFVDLMGLRSSRPDLDWGRRAPGSPFRRFHDLYWMLDGMAEDRPTPGLGAFVHRVSELGGDVVFISGRWLKAHVQVSLRCLRRAGITSPKLVIGNDRHESLVPAGTPAASDAEAKAALQAEVRARFGRPVAVVDDRAANRLAVAGASGDPAGVLGVAICIPGFSCDPAGARAPLRISSFETFDAVVGDAPRRPLMVALHDGVGRGAPWRGLYEGLGRNDRPYVLPRVPGAGPPADGGPPFAAVVAGGGPLAEDVLVDRCEATIPPAEVDKIDACIESARNLSGDMAAPFPPDAAARLALRRCLVASWLHSRDIQTVMTALGYPIAAAGVHDLVEHVAAAEVRRAVAANVARGAAYSDWLLRWVASLDPAGRVNVGCLNPHLLVSMWAWLPTGDRPQDAMDVHRLTSHHEGDGDERYDPLEAAVNNLLHLREGRSGIRKEPIVSWDSLEAEAGSETRLEALGKSSIGRDWLRDAIAVGRRLEQEGWITPWGMCEDARRDWSRETA
jgi:hypothetical protein